MDILAVQQRVLDVGLSYRERRGPNNVGSVISIYQPVQVWEKRVFVHETYQHTRHDAWKCVAEWLDKREAGET